VEEVPLLKQFEADFRGDGLSIVGISLDTDLNALRGMVRQKVIDWPQICDGQGFESDLVRRFNVRGTPRFYLLDRNGRIAAKFEGEQGKEIPKLRKAIVELLAADHRR
jgi:hypothetical protein